MKTLNIKTIRIDGGTQSRVEINNEVVSDYAEAIKVGIEFPPVVVFHDGADYWLADGFHRFHAHNQAGKASIAADVRKGTVRDAILFSAGANGAHGLRRTNADKRKAVETILSDGEWVKWSDRRIAEVCGVGAPLVGDVRKAICNPITDAPTVRTVERAGKTYQQDTANIGVKQHREASKIAHETNIARGGSGSPTPEEDYSELDAAQDQISGLQDALAVATMGEVSSEDKEQAKNLIAELRAEVKTLRATLKAVTTSRDSLMNELAQVKRQCISQQRELKRLKEAA